MKLNPDFVIRNVANTWVVLPMGKATLDLNGMLTLNDSAVLLWRTLERESSREDLADALLAEYDVSREQALADVEEFLQVLRKAGCLLEP